MSSKTIHAAIAAATLAASQTGNGNNTLMNILPVVSALRNTESRRLGNNKKKNNGHHHGHDHNHHYDPWGGWGHSSGDSSSSSSSKSGKSSKSSSSKSSKSSSTKSSKSSGKSSKSSSGKSGKSSPSSSGDDKGKWVWVGHDHSHGHDGWGSWGHDGSSGKSGKSGSGSGSSGKSGKSGSGSGSDSGSSVDSYRHDDDDYWSDDGHAGDPLKCSSNIPNENEVEILINAMDFYATKKKSLVSQWTRAAFHDAGTYNKNIPEGGANGCLMNHFEMREEDANYFMEAPLNTLQALKEFWHSHPDTCMTVSSADMLQFAIFFATIRQSGTPGLTKSKIEKLKTEFEWGRPDEKDCDTAWTENLPENPTGHAYGGPITVRCMAAGKEIREKMMERNGFTAEEAVALIGAHTIGMTRHIFGEDHAGVWVGSGHDDATSKGPIFDNEFHTYFPEKVPARNVPEFEISQDPFSDIFPNWYREEEESENFLDTDMVLAFPSVDESVYPHYNEYTHKFAKSNDDFLESFFTALDKMSKLGVRTKLSTPHECKSNCNGGKLTQPQQMDLTKALHEALDEAEEAAAELQEERQSEIKNLTTHVDMVTFFVPGWTAEGWVGDAWNGDAF